MKSRMKLIATITSICLAVGMLFVGVYAATTRVDFGITGNILYEVEDTYVEITTKIYKSTTLLSKGQVADTVEELANLSFTQIDSKGLVHLTQNDDTYSSLEDTTGNGEYDGVDELTLTFSTSGSNVAFAYFIVMNVKNLTTNENIYAVMQDEREDCENLFEYDNALQENILKTEDNRNIVIGLTVDKFNTPITSGSFTYGINVGTGDIARSEQMTSKVTVEDGAYYWTEDAKGVVVLDPAVDGVTELVQYGGTSYDEATPYGDEITAIIIRQGLDTIDNESIVNPKVNKLVLSLDICEILDAFANTCYTVQVIESENSDYCSQNESGEELNCVIQKSTKTIIQGSNNAKFDKLPDDILAIGSKAFYGCTALESIDLGSVQSIGDYAFSNCTGLESIVIPDSVSEIGDGAFNSCTGLTSIDLGSVQSIGYNAFYNCTGLESIVVDESNTKYTSKINGVETNCIIEKGANNAYTVILGCKNSTLPYGITSVGSHAFYICTGLTSIVIPDSVTIISNDAFSDCTGLTSIDLGSVQTIGQRAFWACTGLESIVIPDSVSEIGSNAFYGWTAEQSIYFEGTSYPENLAVDWKNNCKAKIYLNGVLQN